MALAVRTMSNTGEPIYRPNGTLLPDGTEIVFTLVDEHNETPIIRFDATHGEAVLASVTATTTSGVFSVSLWTSERADELCYIRMSIPTVDTPDIVSYVPVGAGTYKLSDFASTAYDGTLYDPAITEMRVRFMKGTTDPPTWEAKYENVLYVKYV